MTTCHDVPASALRIAQTGRCYDLATELGHHMPQGPPETFGGFRVTPYRTPQALIQPEDPPPFDFSMELITGSVHVGTHIDGLAHIHSRGCMFGGHRTTESYTDFGWRHNGAETIAPIIVRGILLDVASALGVTVLQDGHEITVAELRACARIQGTEVRTGDAVLVRTGKIAQFLAHDEQYFAGQPGVGADAAIWLHDQGMSVLGTDTSGTEPHPILDLARTTHQAMLVDRGVHLLEILDLEQLARDHVYEFCLICLPLKIVGATGSWVRPVALV